MMFQLLYVCCERLLELALNAHNRTIHGEVRETRKSLANLIPNFPSDGFIHHQQQEDECTTPDNGPDSSNASDISDEIAALNLDNSVTFDPKIYSVAHAMTIIQHSQAVMDKATKLRVCQYSSLHNISAPHSTNQFYTNAAPCSFTVAALL